MERSCNTCKSSNVCVVRPIVNDVFSHAREGGLVNVAIGHFTTTQEQDEKMADELHDAAWLILAKYCDTYGARP